MLTGLKHAVRRGARNLRFKVVRRKTFESIKSGFYSDAQKSMNESLVNAVANSDHFFDRTYGEEMLAYVVKHCRPNYQGRTFVKYSRNRFECFNGLTAHQNLILEAYCLARFNATFPGDDRLPFPRLVDIDTASNKIVMTHTDGVCLRELRERIRVPVHLEQVEDLLNKLTVAGVVQLDMSSRNVTVDGQGNISLIDFDICAIDGLTYGVHQAITYRQFESSGGISRFREDLIDELRRCDFLDLR